MKNTAKAPATVPAMSLEHLLMHLQGLSQMVKNIQSGTIGIVQNNNSESSVQLQDVLKSTEDATLTIIDSATAIQGIIAANPIAEKDKKAVEALITKIYEACNFQDITGQRIKKVLKNFEDLEARVVNLADATKAGVYPVKKIDSELVSGPQLSTEAPSQDDVDKLFKS
jgi:chemotaxis protein CheZ